MMKKELNIRQIQQDAEETFRSGGFYCSEAIMFSIRKNIAPEMPQALIAAASGFPVGVGRSKCLCGAISGGVLALGYFLGKEKATNGEYQKSIELANELQQSFRNKHKGVSCCHIHTKGMDMASGEHKQQCVAFTGEMAIRTARILARELELKIFEDEVISS